MQDFMKINFKMQEYVHVWAYMNLKLQTQDQMSQFFQKHGEFMDYNNNMDMHVIISMKTTLNFKICICMHDLALNATI